MAPPKTKTASPSPGPSTTAPLNPIADALYAWCRENHDPGYVFSQEELLAPGIIPDDDQKLVTLLSAVTHLVAISLLRIHDRAGGTLGWELIDEGKAKDYTSLGIHERLVLQCIDGAKNSGIWTKTIQHKTSLHAKVLDRVYKNLEGRGLVRQMKSVNHMNRKMYILTGLEPSDEATGGSWFSEGRLDVGLIDTISKVVEHYVSTHSWQPIDQADQPQGQKRKRPSSGFEERGEDGARFPKTHVGLQKAKPSKQGKSHQPFDPGYKSYPTLRDITRHIHSIKVTATNLPQNAINQLLQVMVYDDRLFKMHRSPNADELPDDLTKDTITMYRCFKTPHDLLEQHNLEKHKVSSHDSVRKSAYRQQELEDIGPGGASEVPCMRCPVFDICGDGGPVNVVTCKYFDEWYVNLEIADREVEMGELGAKERETEKEKGSGKGKGKESAMEWEKAEKAIAVVNGGPDPDPDSEADVDIELEPS